MMTPTHFLTGYLLALAFKDKEGKQEFRYDGYIPLFFGIMASLPDLIEVFTPNIPHATWSHTIIAAIVMGLIYSIMVFFLAPGFFSDRNIRIWRWIGLNLVVIMTHLLLDIATHQKFQCEQAEADGLHIYFWPFWNKSFHLDCLFGWSYLTRVLIEWAIYFPIILLIVVYRWKKLHENLLHIFDHRRWACEKPIKTRELIGLWMMTFGLVIAFVLVQINISL